MLVFLIEILQSQNRKTTNEAKAVATPLPSAAAAKVRVQNVFSNVTNALDWEKISWKRSYRSDHFLFAKDDYLAVINEGATPPWLRDDDDDVCRLKMFTFAN